MPIQQTEQKTTPLAPGQDQKLEVAELIGVVYTEIPPVEQRHLLSQILKPLGLLSLAAVANGVFARLWLRGDSQHEHLRLDDAHNLPPSDIVALVHFVQQVSAETIEGLASTLCTSPTLVGSAAAAMLLRVLMRRIQERSEKHREGRRGARPAGAH